MPQPDRIIPLARLAEGLDVCAQNIRDFVADARLVLAEGHGYHAVALAIFAFEELGKYSELNRLGEESRKNGASYISVADDLFRSHQYKQNIARTLIEPDKVILQTPFFDAAYFDSAFFDTKEVVIEPNLRLECVFVDWLDGGWRYGTEHETERLKLFLDAIIDALDEIGG